MKLFLNTTQRSPRWVACMTLVLALPWQLLFAQGAVPAIKLSVREGEGALNNIKIQRAKEPVVIVTDVNDRPLKGATVTFLLPPELGPGGSFPSGPEMMVTTGADGVAVGRGLRPNNVSGEFEIRVVANFMGQSVRAAIHQTNVAPQSGGGGGKKAAIILAVLGGAGAAVAVGVTRGNKTSSPTQPSGTSISAGGSTFGPPR